MSAPNLSSPAYATLTSYAVLAGAAITSAGTTTLVGGVYGSSPTPSSATLTGTLDNGNAGTAQTQLTALVNAVNAFTATLPATTISGASGSTVTYLPNRNYNSGAGGITYDTNAVINFDAQGNPSAQFFITAGTAITFTTTTINLLNGACAGNIFMRAGSAITFTTMTNAVPGNLLAGTTITSATATAFRGRMYAQTAAIAFNGGGPNSVTVTQCPTEVVCYREGTKILTPDGYRAIDTLNVEDAVITAGRIEGDSYSTHAPTSSPVLWISSFTIRNPNREARPICFKANSLGPNMPSEDLYVSAGHAMLVDGKTAPAWSFVNGTTIVRDMDCTQVKYYHFETKHHSAIVANGVLSETFTGGIDNENRLIFGRAPLMMSSFNDVTLSRPFLTVGGRR